jgi:anti-sigma regulatory factor (Ser/Thr protein kinase)
LTLTCDGNAVGPDGVSFASDDGGGGALARLALVRRLTERGARVDERACAELVLGELVANAVRYAPGQIDVVFEWNGPRPIVHVLDRGSGFRFSPSGSTDPHSERGRGLYIANTLAESINATPRRGGGSHVRAVLAIGSLPRRA